MTRIQILPEVLSNKIAAGEVVERPASVVKELVENALDAASDRIEVLAEEGGRRLIQVADNGHGMSADDALLCIERYATSKIQADPDLFAIRTLGFRGEALPSIASVSKFSLTTREAGAATGTQIRIEGGKVLGVSEVGAPPGTLIQVRQLFYNMPARRKFLKAISTEMGHVADTLASQALGRPEVHFSLSHNGRTVRNWSRCAEPVDRVAAVLGKGVRRQLYPLHFKDLYLTLTGWVGAPHVARKTSRGIHLYVNGRYVKDRSIQHALFQGYTGRLMKGQFPLAVLYLELPYDQVDVNVHPTKHAVRFAQQRRIHHIVQETVAQALVRAERSTWAVTKSGVADGGQSAPSPTSSPAPEGVAQASPAYDAFRRTVGGPSPSAEPRHGYPASPFSRAAETPEQGTMPTPPDAATDSEVAQTALWPIPEDHPCGEWIPLGQIRATYLLCESPDGLVIVDQHAAHERITFETLRQAHAGRPIESQGLLLPETLELSHAEAEILERLQADMARMGLVVEPFGGTTFVIKAVPVILGKGAAAGIVRDVVDRIAEVGFGSGVERVIESCLVTIACHRSIRAHQRLSEAEMKALLVQLGQCDNPAHCPHGRPTWVRWSVRELEKAFGRLG
ncbi:MAG: DNA mismatch repair endonuclease MutL [Desulfosarcinaceae bacterium]|nr:DNA mismatch repair endonuclease MutL [Desulfosarcinaceae bacterium]